MLTIIEQRVCVDNHDLTSNIKECILQKVKDISIGTCSKENGYILDVKRVVKIKDNYISSVNCESIFIVSVEVETLKPENGKAFDGEVCMIFSGGVFLNIKDKQKVLIPITNLKEYTYSQACKTFKKDKETIKEGDKLRVLITGTKYFKQAFSCFGTLV